MVERFEAEQMGDQAKDAVQPWVSLLGLFSLFSISFLLESMTCWFLVSACSRQRGTPKQVTTVYPKYLLAVYTG
jgi:hypothetical protein